jgi:hypothetical protein
MLLQALRLLPVGQIFLGTAARDVSVRETVLSHETIKRKNPRSFRPIRVVRVPPSVSVASPRGRSTCGVVCQDHNKQSYQLIQVPSAIAHTLNNSPAAASTPTAPIAAQSASMNAVTSRLSRAATRERARSANPQAP